MRNWIIGLVAAALSFSAYAASFARPVSAAAIGTDLPAEAVVQNSQSDVSTCDAWIHGRHSGDSPALKRVGAATLCLDTVDGELADASASDFIAALRTIPADRRPVVVVRSLGGDVAAGLDMGEALVSRRATVVVSMFCGSSCANYLFFAAEKRRVLPDGVVFFHGGMNKATLENWVGAQSGTGASKAHTAAVRAKLATNLRRQRRLLRTRGIDPDFFEWMESLNSDPTLIDRQCPGLAKVNYIVFSDAFLASKGANVADDKGPQSPAELKRVLQRFGLAENSCYWK